MAISVEDREAKIGKPAPDFCCTAVHDEEFVEVKLRYFTFQNFIQTSPQILTTQTPIGTPFSFFNRYPKLSQS